MHPSCLLTIISRQYHIQYTRIGLPPLIHDLYIFLISHLPLLNSTPTGSTHFSLEFVFARVWFSTGLDPDFLSMEILSRTPLVV